MSVYAVSDLHGQFHTFAEGLKRISFGDRDRLYVIGDAIDRGPDGIKLLQYIKEHPNMDLILGNHEFMMLNSVDLSGKTECNGPDTDLWIRFNGGGFTYMEYTELTLAERHDLLEWLNNRYVIRTINVNNELFCLTHSYYDARFENKKYRDMAYADVWDVVWKSIYRFDELTHGKNIYPHYHYTFITGHVPVQIVMDEYAGYMNPNRLRAYKNANMINIDGGCGRTLGDGLQIGALFYRLDDKKTFAVPLVNS